MPGSLLEPVFEIVFQLIGYGTAKFVIPRLTGGKIDIAPSDKEGVSVESKSRLYRTLPCGTIVLSAEVGIIAGLLLWVLIVFSLVRFLSSITA